MIGLQFLQQCFWIEGADEFSLHLRKPKDTGSAYRIRPDQLTPIPHEVHIDETTYLDPDAYAADISTRLMKTYNEFLASDSPGRENMPEGDQGVCILGPIIQTQTPAGVIKNTYFKAVQMYIAPTSSLEKRAQGSPNDVVNT
ncbi:MAG: hypothetical protein ABIH34_05765 [Nanoarchaeota archaeon]